jgi:hypothetical protein
LIFYETVSDACHACRRQRWLISFSLDDEELRTGSDATKERSLGSVELSLRSLRRHALSEHGARIFGVLAIAVSLVIVWFYFYLRRAIARDEALQKPRWR